VTPREASKAAETERIKAQRAEEAAVILDGKQPAGSAEDDPGFLGIKADGTYVTPDSRSVLPSITNLSLKQVAADLGWKVECRPIPYDEIATFAEIAACGTAVVVTPVWEITRGEDVIRVGDETTVGPHLQKLYETVQGIQYGTLDDVHGWCHEVPL
jgi:branched-chain amino acid aminotransferase